MTTNLIEPIVTESRYFVSANTTEQLLMEVLADIIGIEQVPSDSNFFDDLGADSMMMARFCARIRKQTDLPPISMKKVYEHPTVSRLAMALSGATPIAATPEAPASATVAPETADSTSAAPADMVQETAAPTIADSTTAGPPNATEQQLSEVLADIMGVEQVPSDSNFFDDLGADSMMMARFCARIRKQTDLPPISIKKVYEHPTISGLAMALSGATPIAATPIAATPEAATPEAPASATVAPETADSTSAAPADMVQETAAPTSADSTTAGPPNATEQQLSEVLADIIGIEQVPSDSNFFDDLGADSMMMARFCARIRKQTDLPPISIKKVYEHPTISGLAMALSGATPIAATLIAATPITATSEALAAATVAPETATPETAVPATTAPTNADSTAADTTTADLPNATEQLLNDVLADIMGIEQVPSDSNFFDDLGADSMMMARFCARIRKRNEIPSVSIKMVYAHPTINRLAAALTEAIPKAVSIDKPLTKTTNEASIEREAPPVPMPTSEPMAAKAVAPKPAAANPDPITPLAQSQLEEPIGKPMYHLCGALQILTIFGYLLVIAGILEGSYKWIVAGSGFTEIYIRSLLVGNGVFIFWSFLPILMKWVLIGRWKPQQIRIWSLAYYRFWLVKFLLRLNPMNVFVGSPLYVLYLRALGAKIGRGVVIMSNHVPVCTDLLTIGDNTVIRKDSYFNCYHARNGLIQTGSVTIGSNAYVGEMTVLDIDTSLGDGAQIGHSSSLHSGQSIPDGEHRYGSPAQERTEVDYRGVETTYVDPLRKATYTMVQLVNTFLSVSIFYIVLISLIPRIAELKYFALLQIPFSPWVLLGEAVLITVVFYFGSILLGLIFVVTVPRMLNLALEPDKAYPLYGFRYWAHQNIGRITNVKFYPQFFGDSAYIVYYLRWLGYNIAEPIVQTGSNFGTAVKHDNPFLVSIGSGTVIADGLSSVNADYSNTSFQVSQVTIGSHNFLGNNIAYPARGKTGDNCLLATKVAVPIEGEVREGVGLLGSPSFNIPRSVQRDLELDHPDSNEDLVHKLTTKTEHNLVTMGLFLLMRWFSFFIAVMFFLGAANLYPIIGISAFALAMLLRLFVMPFYSIMVERATTLFQNLEPQQCSIYEPYFWFHERYWKLSMQPSQLALFDGMPLKSFAWRLLGVKIGKRVFDDGAAIVEKTMVTVGDNCTLNVGATIQPHSQEDGGFKSDYVSIGDGCTLGVGAFVHYGVTIGDGSQLEASSFLMKGEEVPQNTLWGDNPAMELQDLPAEEVVKVAVPFERAVNEAAQPKGAQPKGAQPKGAQPKGAQPKGAQLHSKNNNKLKRTANLLPALIHWAADKTQMARAVDNNQMARAVDNNQMARVRGEYASVPANLLQSYPTASAYLKNVSGEAHVPSTFLLEGHREVRIGRKSLYCQHVINHPKVSRLHATIIPDNGAFYIKDEGSSGGTSVNAQKLDEAEIRRLKHNDIVHFNDVKYRFEIPNSNVGMI